MCINFLDDDTFCDGHRTQSVCVSLYNYNHYYSYCCTHLRGVVLLFGDVGCYLPSIHLPRTSPPYVANKTPKLYSFNFIKKNNSFQNAILQPPVIL